MKLNIGDRVSLGVIAGTVVRVDKKLVRVDFDEGSCGIFNRKNDDRLRRLNQFTMSVTIDLEDDAFADEPHAEMARLVKKVSENVITELIIYRNGTQSGTVRDINGNRCGSYKTTYGGGS